MGFKFDTFTISGQPASSELVGLHNKINFFIQICLGLNSQTCFLQDCDVRCSQRITVMECQNVRKAGGEADVSSSERFLDE